MLEVKIFEDREQVRQIEGEAIFIIAVTDLPDEGNVHTQSSIRGEANLDVLFDAVASSCAKHLASLSKSEEDGCMRAGKFIDDILMYSVEYLEEKYGNKEGAEDGSIED